MIPPKLRAAVLERDGYRCRWCGRTNVGVDAHHIRYRRGPADDVLENLISLDRACHEYVHGIPLSNGGTVMSKAEAQEILFRLVETPGVTGMALRRQMRSRDGSVA